MKRGVRLFGVLGEEEGCRGEIRGDGLVPVTVELDPGELAEGEGIGEGELFWGTMMVFFGCRGEARISGVGKVKNVSCSSGEGILLPCGLKVLTTTLSVLLVSSFDATILSDSFLSGDCDSFMGDWPNVETDNSFSTCNFT